MKILLLSLTFKYPELYHSKINFYWVIFLHWSQVQDTSSIVGQKFNEAFCVSWDISAI